VPPRRAGAGALDRCFGGGTLRDDMRLRRALLRQEVAVALDGGAEHLYLRQDACVERRHALRAVHATDHVVEASRPEHDLERRCLIRGVQRHEPLRDDSLAALQVVLGESELVAVLSNRALNLRQLSRRRVVLSTRAFE
jgi:hypothetical protein